MLTHKLDALRGLAPLVWLRTLVTKGLHLMGLGPQPEHVYREVEDQFSGALPRVAAPADFRRELASNLALIAQHKSAGLIITHPHPYRPGILVGVGAGALATAVAILVLVCKSRLQRRARA
jgi:hypothetical protein